MTPRVRKRPVSFGNPALGTYSGFVYTIEHDSSTIGVKRTSNVPPPLVEGAEAVDRMVAMVDVPPEQVPEGILNLARSHRPFIEHVKIFIAEPEKEATRPLSFSTRAAHNSEKQDDLLVVHPITSTATSTTTTAQTTTSTATSTATSTTTSTSTCTTSRNNAPSTGTFLAQDELGISKQALVPPPPPAATSSSSSSIPESYSSPRTESTFNWSFSDVAEEQRPLRSYLVLFHLSSERDADTMVEDLHGRPYTSLDETVTCSVHTVVALEGEGGVMLFNSIFSPSTNNKNPRPAEMLPPTSRGDEEPDNTTTMMKTLSTTSTSGTSNTYHRTEDPNCAVCLEHMSLDPGDGDKTSILTTVCNHTFHLDCLLQCQDSPCPVCRYDHSGLNETLSQCHVCGTTERNYVCLICGVVSCVSGTSAPSSSVQTRPHSLRGGGGEDDRCDGGAGIRSSNSNNGSAAASRILSGRNRYSLDDPETETSEVTAQRFYTSHANQHYDETLHAYALDTETQHVWDFAGQGYVHRLLQNKEDGKLVEVTDPNNTTSQERSSTPGLSDAQEGEVVHRKLEGFASQYYTLLKSQLEQQRTFYEGRLEEIRREFAIQKANAINDRVDLIAVLKQEKRQLSHRLVSIKRKKEKVTNDVAFLKSMNESLEANKAPLEEKIKQAQREQIESREMIQKYLPALEEKVTTLMLELEESLNTTYTPSTSSAWPPP